MSYRLSLDGYGVLKITHVINALIKGGGERVAADLANQAARDGHQVTLVAAWPVDSTQLRDTLHPDVQVVYASKAPGSKLSVYLGLFPWLWRHRFWVAEQDVLHCHLTYGAVFGSIVRFFRPILGLRKPAVVETYHSAGMPMSALYRWIRARMAARFDAFALMAEDDYWRGFIKRRPGLLSSVIPNGVSFQELVNVDLVARRNYRREIGIPDDCRYVVGTVGMLRPDRKPWLYFPIFAEAARILGPEVHFVLAGGGSEYERLRVLAAENGLENQVHFTGLVLEPRFPLSIMDVYLTLNVGSVTGIAALEAAYMGLPVLAIQMLSNYRALPGDWIWSSTNLLEIGTRVVDLLRLPENRQALAERQAAHVRTHHTVETMARSYEALYRAAVERAERG